jgi:hypothetical protein
LAGSSSPSTGVRSLRLLHRAGLPNATSRLHIVQREAPVPPGGLKGARKPAALQPVLHGVGRRDPNQGGGLLPGERGSCGTRNQPINQVAASSLPEGGGHLTEESRADRSHGPNLRPKRQNRQLSDRARRCLREACSIVLSSAASSCNSPARASRSSAASRSWLLSLRPCSIEAL